MWQFIQMKFVQNSKCKRSIPEVNTLTEKKKLKYKMKSIKVLKLIVHSQAYYLLHYLILYWRQLQERLKLINQT